MKLLGAAVTGVLTPRGRRSLGRRILFGAAVLAPLIYAGRPRKEAAEPVMRLDTAETPTGEIGVR